MAAGALIDASATLLGDGGEIVVWSDIYAAESITEAVAPSGRVVNKEVIWYLLKLQDQA